MIATILNALIAIPQIAKIVEAVCVEVTTWWMGRQQSETYQAIIDAAALSAKAQSQADRQAALEKWRTALSRPRYL